MTADGRRVRLHSLLARPGIHVLLRRDAEDLERTALGAYVVVHQLTSEPGAGLVAVRPDGYVGFRCGRADTGQLSAWLAHIGVSHTHFHSQGPEMQAKGFSANRGS